ncbi:hypothetical protein FQZ97_734110 [compost metagenome]
MQHLWQTLVVGGWRRQTNEVEACLRCRNAEFLVHFRRQVNNDEAINAGCFCISKEAFNAINIDRIVIAHQDDWRCVVILAEVSSQLQRLFERLTSFERPQASSLNGRAISHRIREGHTKFDHVGASLGQRLHHIE